MSKVLLKLDNPSKILKEYLDDIPYAFIVDNINDLEECHLAIIFNTKEDYDKKEGFVSYIEEGVIENIFEWTASLID